MTTKILGYAELAKLHEAERQRIIKDEGEISIYKTYQVLDDLANAMWIARFGNVKSVTISASEIIKNAVTA